MADFLLYLFQNRKYSPACIKSYRSSLALIFRYRLPEVSTSPVLADLIRYFELSAVRRQPVVQWDLKAVLAALREPPYEPIREVNLCLLTCKVLFLVALGTAKRIGEWHFLSAKVPSIGGDLSLSHLPEFIAKSDRRAKIPRHFLLKSLGEFVGFEREEMLLCPVRVLRHYLHRTAKLENRPRNLFVSPSNTSRPLSKNAMSFFIKKVIMDSGALQPHSSAPRAHSVRSAATSLAFTRNAPLQEILEAATWKNSTTFTSFYLNDVAFNLDEIRSLGPVVAAGQVLSN